MASFKPKVVFLDIGGVLLTNGWDHHSRIKAAKEFNLDYGELEALHNFIFNIYEIGQVSLDDYLDTVIFSTSRDFTRHDFKDFIYDQSEMLPNMLDWMIEWKNKHKIKVISINNEGKELNDYRVQKFNLHRCFDAFITSCEVGKRKPDPGIFKMALGIAQVNPADCIYFDDRILTVMAAEKLGIKSYQHLSFESTKEILENTLS